MNKFITLNKCNRNPKKGQLEPVVESFASIAPIMLIQLTPMLAMLAPKLG